MTCKEIISACRGTQNVAARKSAVSNCIANALRHLSFAVIATVRTVKTRQNLRRSGRRPSKVSKKEIPAPSSPKLVPRMEDICVVVTARSQAAKRNTANVFKRVFYVEAVVNAPFVKTAVQLLMLSQLRVV